MTQFYTYTYHDETMTPYYVGKGSGNRAYKKHKKDNHGGREVPIPLTSRILTQNWESEEKAFEMEKWWIRFWGRKDVGSGCLWNLTEGGDAPDVNASRLGGKANVKSGQLQKIASLGGRVQGKRNVDSGQISRMNAERSVESRQVWGKKCIENGVIVRMNAARSTESRRSTMKLVAHNYWHVRRGVFKINCAHCQEETQNAT